MAEALKLEPLSGAALPKAVAAVLSGPAPAKLMALRGMAPLRPAELLVAIYQLSFDSDAQVTAAAEAAPATLPDRVVLAPLAEALPPPVLHFFAERLPPARHQAIEKILYNLAAADETFVALAKRLDESLLEIIFQNDVRLLRCPALVEALYFNKQARMSSVSRALELYARSGLRLDGIPAFAETVAAIMADPSQARPSAQDEAFVAALDEATDGTEASATESAGPVNADTSAGTAESESEPRGRPRSASFIKFEELKIFEKIRLASIGNAHCRQVLIRDSNRVVAMAAVRSSSITDAEIVAAAANRAVCDDVIRFIANSRHCSKDYAVKQALVNNPKCPLPASMHLLPFLRPDDLKALARSRNVPGALATAAKKLLQTRERSSG